MTTTYCSQADLEAILGRTQILRMVDDNEDGVASISESQRIADAMHQAASEMNVFLSARYFLSDLAGSEWCRWCNAYLAVERLVSRRGNAPSSSIRKKAEDYQDRLREIRDGKTCVPDAIPTVSSLPAATRYVVDLNTFPPVKPAC